MPAAPKICRECGVIEAVNAIEQPGQGSGLGAVAGGVLGGVLGHQVGNGRGKDLATIAGAVGGAVAGNQIEKSVKKKVEYDVLVRLEDNTAQTVHFQSDPGFRTGDRVKVVDGQIQRQ
jgi:outer membrane lipoprotein SlyB